MDTLDAMFGVYRAEYTLFSFRPSLLALAQLARRVKHRKSSLGGVSSVAYQLICNANP